jgi:hypothetical protein
MFDDLRAQANEAMFDEQEEVADAYTFRTELSSRPRGHFLGMKPSQRFVIAVMLFMMTCILSAFCLMVTEKVWLPFLG